MVCDQIDLAVLQTHALVQWWHDQGVFAILEATFMPNYYSHI